MEGIKTPVDISHEQYSIQLVTEPEKSTAARLAEIETMLQAYYEEKDAAYYGEEN